MSDFTNFLSIVSFSLVDTPLIPLSFSVLSRCLFLWSIFPEREFVVASYLAGLFAG
jgi:hypothetical protein